MTRAIASTWIVLCLMPLVACTGTQPRESVPPNILAMTEPAPRPTQTIDALATEEDETVYVIQAAATMKKDELSFKRLREYLLGNYAPKSWWQRFKGVFGAEDTPAGGGQ